MYKCLNLTNGERIYIQAETIDDAMKILFGNVKHGIIQGPDENGSCVCAGVGTQVYSVIKVK